MNFEEALYSYLTGVSAITALVNYKIYPLNIPQNIELPAIVYQKISGYRYHSLNADTGDTSPVYQISIYSKSYSEMKSIVNQVRKALVNYAGTMGGVGGVAVTGTLIESEIEGSDKATDGIEYYTHLDFQFFYKELVT